MKNFSKKSKLISLILAICVLLSSVFSITAFGAEVDENVSTACIDMFSYESGASYNQEFADYMKQELLNYSNRIEYYKFGVSTEEACQIYQNVIFENEELFYVSTGFSYSSNAIFPQYTFTEEEYQVAKAEFDKTVQKYLSKIDSSWDDETKALILHDELVLNCSYSYDEYDELDFTAYGALVEGDAVCQGYTLAYNYLLKQLGIDAVIVISNAMNHAWSMVNIDGEYYHVDVTWDDPVPDKLGRVKHTNFLLSDVGISDSRHYYWDAEYEATSKKYDNYFWKTIDTSVYYVNDCYYHIHNIHGHKNFGWLVEYDNGECKPLYNIGEHWYVNDGSGAYWVDDFSYLAYENNRFYFDTPKAIYSVDINGEDLQLVYELNEEQKALGDIYGMVVEDGKIYVSMAQSPNENVVNIYLTDINTDKPVEPTEPPTAPSEPVTEPVTEPPTAPSEPVTEPPTAPSEPVTEPTQPREIGDVDNDNLISIKDATIIQSIIAKFMTVSEDEKVYADANGDGYLTITDATIVQMRCAKMNYI